MYNYAAARSGNAAASFPPPEIGNFPCRSVSDARDVTCCLQFRTIQFTLRIALRARMRRALIINRSGCDTYTCLINQD